MMNNWDWYANPETEEQRRCRELRNAECHVTELCEQLNVAILDFNKLRGAE